MTGTANVTAMSVSTMSSWFPIVFAIVGVLIVGVFAYVIYSMLRSRRVLRRAGRNPDTIQADLLNQVMDSDALRSTGGSREQRLAELDRLHAAGTITDGERATARAQILGT